jgi:hypothetical protein
MISKLSSITQYHVEAQAVKPQPHKLSELLVPLVVHLVISPAKLLRLSIQDHNYNLTDKYKRQSHRLLSTKNLKTYTIGF